MTLADYQNAIDEAILAAPTGFAPNVAICGHRTWRNLSAELPPEGRHYLHVGGKPYLWMDGCGLFVGRDREHMDDGTFTCRFDADIAEAEAAAATREG